MTSGGRQMDFQNEEERRDAIDHIRLMARRKYLGEREALSGAAQGGLVVGEAWLKQPMKDKKVSSMACRCPGFAPDIGFYCLQAFSIRLTP